MSERYYKPEKRSAGYQYKSTQYGSQISKCTQSPKIANKPMAVSKTAPPATYSGNLKRVSYCMVTFLAFLVGVAVGAFIFKP